MLENIISKLSDKKYEQIIREEYEIIGEDRLYDLMQIHKILENNYKRYSLSGTINSFYICRLLDIISVDPIKLNIKHDNKFYYSINVPLNEKDNLIKLIRKEIIGVKKVSKVSNKNNLYYDGIVIDKNNELSIYRTGIIKNKKIDIINKFQVINIYEKETLTLLEKMNYGNDEMPKGFYYLNLDFRKKIYTETKDKTVYEIITENIEDKDFDLKQLIMDNPVFNINHLDHVILESDLTYFKYNQSRDYYVTYLDYLSQKVNINIIKKYRNNFSDFFKENKDELTYEFKFYNLLYDYLQELKKERKYISKGLINDIKYKSNDIYIEIKNNNIILNHQNIIKVPTTSQNKFDVLLEIINLAHKLNKEIDIFGYNGNNIYYLSALLSRYANIDILESETIVNPLGGTKIGFDYNLEYIKEKSLKDYKKFIKYFATKKVFLNTERVNIYELISISNCGTEIIVIDNLRELADRSNITEEKIIEILNKLNKRIFILERRCK